MRINEPGSVSSKPAAPAKREPSPAQRIRSGVISAFNDLTGRDEEHQTTAGEVQGQSQYPGVPGYSTLDNWTRSQATGTYTAPDYAIQLLEKAGYAQPTTKGTGRQTIPGLNMNAADDLTPYGYSVTDEEARNILETYAPDAKGDPAKITAERVESKDRAVPMKMAAYKKLTPDQRAAVDFNTALIAAREKDLADGWMIKDQPELSPTTGIMQSAFGKDTQTGGNPEHTMALLEKIGYKVPGSNLTDFMSLDMAISAEELRDLKLPKDIQFFSKPEPGEAKKPDPDAPADWTPEGQFVPGDPSKQGGNAGQGPTDQAADYDYSQLRSAENLGMIQLDVIRKASEYLAKNRVLDRTPATTAAVSFGTPLGPGNDTPRAWNMNGPVDPIHSTVFDILLNDTTQTKVANHDSFWAQLKSVGYKEKDIDKLFSFIDERTRWMIDNDMKPLEGQNDATIIRELAGLGPANG